MGHSISAFVAKRAAIVALSRELDNASFYRLKHAEFLILPVGDEIADAFAERRGQSDAVTKDLWQLSANLAQLARECSAHGPIAFVATDYFGGTGTQAAMTWNNGAIVGDPIVGESGCINNALHVIGLEDAPGLDAFDTLGLGDVRSMSDFDEMAPQI